MDTSSQSNGTSSEKRSLGFVKRRRGIVEHIEDGTIDLLEDGIHDYLSLKANLMIGSGYKLPAGVVSTSAPAILAYCKRYVSERTVQRILNHLQDIGWLKCWRIQGKHGNYMVLLCRASVHDRAGREFRVNGEKTTDWRNPVYELVGEETENCRGTVGDLTVNESGISADKASDCKDSENAPVGELSVNCRGRREKLAGLREVKSLERREVREKKEGTAPQSGTLPLPLAVKPFIFLPLNDGTEHPVLPNEVEEWSRLYLAVDVPQALRSMRGWCLANPTKRKTKRGIAAFIVTWLAKEQDRGRQPASRTEPRTFAQIGRDTTDAAAAEILAHARERSTGPRTFDQIGRDETDAAISRVLERVTGKSSEVPIIDVEGD